MRSRLARLFHHRTIKAASARIENELGHHLRSRAAGTAGQWEDNLLLVAKVFVRAHDRRENADYNLEWNIDPTEMSAQIEDVKEAFVSWQAVREEPMAQEYLLAMLGERGRR